MGTQFAEDGRPLPQPNPTTQPFFDAAAEGRLLLQRCPRDGFFFYPRNRCPSCLGADWKWETCSGRGEVHAFTIDRVGHDPSLASQVPFAIAIIELDCGPRMPANLVDVELDAIRVGMPVEATYEKVDDATLIRFRPA